MRRRPVVELGHDVTSMLTAPLPHAVPSQRSRRAGDGRGTPRRVRSARSRLEAWRWRIRWRIGAKIPANTRFVGGLENRRMSRNELCVMTATSRSTVWHSGRRRRERDSLRSLCCPFIELATHGGYETGTSARARAGTARHRRHAGRPDLQENRDRGCPTSAGAASRSSSRARSCEPRLLQQRRVRGRRGRCHAAVPRRQREELARRN